MQNYLYQSVQWTRRSALEQGDEFAWAADDLSDTSCLISRTVMLYLMQNMDLFKEISVLNNARTAGS